MTNTFSIQIDINNCSDMYRTKLYVLLNHLHYQEPDIFNYHTLNISEEQNE